MTFALFVGAGNIVFPPMVGLQAGEHIVTTAFGFLVTAVRLPVLTVVAIWQKLAAGVDSWHRQLVKSLAYCSQQFVPGGGAAFRYAAYGYRLL
ncbi:branched-chain amino acid transport system II carrier protein [Shigella flexneri]